MDINLRITDMAGASPEHSLVIVNFVSAIRKQLKHSTCYVYSDNVQYKFKTENGEDKTVIPDSSINCRTKSRRGNTFVDAPRFVMEVLSPTTEKYDRTEKMEIYCQQEIEEYWIVDKTDSLNDIYDKVTKERKNGKPLQAVLKVEYNGKWNDGFAADYAGVFFVREIISVK